MIVRNQDTDPRWRSDGRRLSHTVSILPRIQGRQCHDDRGAVAFGTANGELTAHRLHTLLDAQQPVSLANTRGLEATAVVTHVQTHSSGAKINRAVSRLALACRIVFVSTS